MADLSKADKIAAGYKKLKEFQQKSKKSKKVQGNSDSDTNNVNIVEKTSVTPKAEENSDVTHLPVVNPISHTAENVPVSEENSQVLNFFDYDKVVYSDSAMKSSESVSVPSIQSYFNNFQNNDQFDQVFRVVESSKTDPVSSTQNSTPSELFFQHSANENSDPVKNVKRDNSTDSNPSSTTVGDSYDLYANESPSSMQQNFGDMVFDQPIKKEYDQNGDEGNYNESFHENLELKPSVDANLYSVDLLDTKGAPENIDSYAPKTSSNEFEFPIKTEEIHPTSDTQNTVTTNPGFIQPEPFTDNSNLNQTSTSFIPSSDQADFSQNQRSPIENIQQLSLGFKNFMGSEDTLSFLQKNQNELEKRNQELAAMLENRNLEVQQLTVRLQEYFSRIQDLETQLRSAQSEITFRVQEELKPLKEQLEYHAQTIGLLVGEKSELTAALEKNQSLINEKIRENEEIQCKLRASRHKVADLEREVSNLKSAFDVRLQSQSYENMDGLKEELVESKKRIDELVEDISELSQKLSSKSQECLTYKQELAEKTNQLSLAELKLHQICNNETSELEFQVETLNKEKLAMELKINHLADELKSLSLEKEKTNEQYQQYVTQLNDQIKSFSTQNEYLTKENQMLKKREVDLTAHISNLEKELQMLLTQKSTVQVDPEEITQLHLKIATLEKQLEDKDKEIKVLNEEKKDLIKELDERHQQIGRLEEKISDLQNDKPDTVRLLAAMESDKAAATQAIKQNAKLTKQVEELQDKFVEFTQRELTLTEKLASEQHLGQEILKQLRARESELESVKQQLNDRDARIAELEKLLEKAVSSQSSSVPPEAPTSSLQQPENKSPVTEHHETEQKENFESSALIPKEEIPCEKCQRNENHLEMSEAMEKLEERFKRTMEDIARLTEERNELEHLVLQLQSETETIGEYVALYQFQRGILKQRTQEKDEELRLLNKDRAEMKQKLAELNYLIQQFVSEKITPSTLVQECQKFNDPQTQQSLNGPPSPNRTDSSVQLKRADKIMELISEINSSNLIEPKEHVAHVCSVCSGKLITV